MHKSDQPSATREAKKNLKKTLFVICYTLLGKGAAFGLEERHVGNAECGLRIAELGMRNKKNDPKAKMSKEGVTRGNKKRSFDRYDQEGKSPSPLLPHNHKK